MRFLYDQNFSPRLVAALEDLHPDSRHVRDLGLACASDLSVWDHAKIHGFVIVSKDDDYREMSFAFGHPPKVIWLTLGNCSTAEIEAALRTAHAEVLAFLASESESILHLG